jgi:hypothetical protein
MKWPLGQPHRITGDVCIAFRGSGRARFRLQHTRDQDGAPDDLRWCEVSQLSNGALANQADAIDGAQMVRGVLVDFIKGDTEVLYRRHSADWLRVIPLDDEDADEIERCARYSITLKQVA